MAPSGVQDKGEDLLRPHCLAQWLLPLPEKGILKAGGKVKAKDVEEEEDEEEEDEGG